MFNLSLDIDIFSKNLSFDDTITTLRILCQQGIDGSTLLSLTKKDFMEICGLSLGEAVAVQKFINEFQ